MNDKTKIAVVIVAAGRGQRAGSENGPKQYQLLGHQTVLAKCAQIFLAHPDITDVVVAIHPDDRDLYDNAITAHDKLHAPVDGGATRQMSVLKGLEAIANYKPDKVLIHDAARPFIDNALITKIVDNLDDHMGILPALAVADTLKRGDDTGAVIETIPRNNLYAAQTPQGFSFEPLLAAHRKAASEDLSDFTDDSALAEWANIPVTLVEGSPQNTKITTKADLEEAQRTMNSPLPDIRVGHGYDTHQLVDGDSLWLCGVQLSHSHGLSGHSDADIGLHALTDALLATISAGDIGSHFPPSDDKWKGAKSDQFLKHAVDLVRKDGGTITHMDVTLVCEAPKISPHRDTMRQAIAKISDVDVSRVSVKATTNERIGFVGREEGMVALATATVVMGTL